VSKASEERGAIREFLTERLLAELPDVVGKPIDAELLARVDAVAEKVVAEAVAKFCPERPWRVDAVLADAKGKVLDALVSRPRAARS